MSLLTPQETLIVQEVGCIKDYKDYVENKLELSYKMEKSNKYASEIARCQESIRIASEASRRIDLEISVLKTKCQLFKAMITHCPEKEKCQFIDGKPYSNKHDYICKYYHTPHEVSTRKDELRKKIEEDHRDKIPFLGDLPGIGKLFGLTKMMDTTTETFIFITPHIIHNPVDDLRRIRQSEYQKRAGDIPEFLHLLDEAKKSQRQNLFDNSLKMLLDMY